MDISKASNFERFVFDLVGRDAAVVRELWQSIDAGGAFDLNATPFMAHLPEFGFVSGSSTHADRLATIRDVWQRHQLMIDPHTADGVKVGREHGIPSLPTVVLETAQAVKFAETIGEALDRKPLRPLSLEGIESLPQQVTVMTADVESVKTFVAARC